MSSKVVNQIFDDFNKARIQFTQSLSDLCLKNHNIELAINTDVILHLRPAILDKIPIVQQNATFVLAKLASFSEETASTIIENDILPHLIFCAKHENRNYRKNCAYTLKCLAKHNSKMANSVAADQNCIDYLIDCLDEYNLKLKEFCLGALSAIVRNDLDLSTLVVSKGVIPLTILCLQEKEVSILKTCINALSELGKHSKEIAKNIVDNNVVPMLIKFLDHEDSIIKRSTCNCLSQIAKHDEELAEVLVENDIFPKILYLLKDPDEIVKKNCANCIKEMSKHNEDLCKIIVKTGALTFLCEYIEEANDNIKLPGILTIGFIGSFSEALSLNIILANSIPILKKNLVEETEDYIKSACVWVLGNIGKHSNDHARKLCDENVLIIFVNLYNSKDSSEDLKKKIQNAAKSVIQKVVNLEALEPVFLKSPFRIAKYSIFQFAKLLPTNPSFRKSFITSGCLQRLQEIKGTEESKVVEAEINIINKSFPEDIVNYYTPGYSDSLIKKIDDLDN